MAEKLFDSVIVEREGHALTIMVQYEKYPLFCAHYKTIGHNLQACSKLNVDPNGKATKKAHNEPHKTQTKPILTYNMHATKASVSTCFDS